MATRVETTCWVSPLLHLSRHPKSVTFRTAQEAPGSDPELLRTCQLLRTHSTIPILVLLLPIRLETMPRSMPPSPRSQTRLPTPLHCTPPRPAPTSPTPPLPLLPQPLCLLHHLLRASLRHLASTLLQREYLPALPGLKICPRRLAPLLPVLFLLLVLNPTALLLLPTTFTVSSLTSSHPCKTSSVSTPVSSSGCCTSTMTAGHSAFAWTALSKVLFPVLVSPSTLSSLAVVHLVKHRPQVCADLLSALPWALAAFLNLVRSRPAADPTRLIHLPTVACPLLLTP